MMPKVPKNVKEKPRLQSISLTLKTLGLSVFLVYNLDFVTWPSHLHF